MWSSILSKSDHEEGLRRVFFKNERDVGVDLSEGFLVGGAEAGAHLAAVTVIRACAKYPHIKLTGQVLIVPVTLA